MEIKPEEKFVRYSLKNSEDIPPISSVVKDNIPEIEVTTEKRIFEKVEISNERGNPQVESKKDIYILIVLFVLAGLGIIALIYVIYLIFNTL